MVKKEDYLAKLNQLDRIEFKLDKENSYSALNYMLIISIFLLTMCLSLAIITEDKLLLNGVINLVPFLIISGALIDFVFIFINNKKQKKLMMKYFTLKIQAKGGKR